jgi:16S rRNA G966 N2-methylase RsmD
VAKLSDDKIGRFRPQLRNANKHTQRGTGMLEASMRKYGYVAPMTAAADGEIIDGSARIETSAGVFGDDVLVVHHDGTKPVIMVRDDIPNADTPEAREISIAANRIAQVNLDFDAEQILEDLQAGVDLEQFWRKDELDEMLADLQPKTTGDTEPETDRAEELRQKWGVKSGDLWQLGNHLLVCGDCTDPATVARVMGGDVAEVVYADPPYGYDKGIEGDEDVGTALDVYLPAMRLAPVGANAWAVVDTPKKYVSEFIKATEAAGWKTREPVLSMYRNSMANGVYGTNIFELSFVYSIGTPKVNHRNLNGVDLFRKGGHDNMHPTQKFIEAYEHFIKLFASDGAIVYEPFSGSGTTLLACENTNRRCRAIEIDAGYTAVCLERWSTHTGRVPTLVAA